MTGQDSILSHMDGCMRTVPLAAVHTEQEMKREEISISDVLILSAFHALLRSRENMFRKRYIWKMIHMTIRMAKLNMRMRISHVSLSTMKQKKLKSQFFEHNG